MIIGDEKKHQETRIPFVLYERFVAKHYNPGDLKLKEIFLPIITQIHEKNLCTAGNAAMDCNGQTRIPFVLFVRLVANYYYPRNPKTQREFLWLLITPMARMNHQGICLCVFWPKNIIQIFRKLRHTTPSALFVHL